MGQRTGRAKERKLFSQDKDRLISEGENKAKAKKKPTNELCKSNYSPQVDQCPDSPQAMSTLGKLPPKFYGSA